MKRFVRGGVIAGAILLLSAQTVLAWPDDATVQLSSTPAGTTAGQPWDVDVSFVSHGQPMTPDGLEPVITIREQATGRELSFTATETKQAGIYHAQVVFPTDGNWSYAVSPNRYGPFFQFPSYPIAPAARSAVGSQPAPAGTPSALYLALLFVAATSVVVIGRALARQAARTA
jgi:hypothetical protein